MRYYLLSLVIFCFCNTHSFGNEGGTSWRPSEVFAEIDFELIGNGIFFPLKGEGNKGLYWLDTGCSVSVFSSSLFLDSMEGKKNLKASGRSDDAHQADTEFSSAKAKSEQQVLRGIRPDNKQLFIKSHKKPKLFMSEQEMIFGEYVLISDFSGPEYTQGLGVQLSGIIGMDFLRKFCVHIDYDHSKLILFHRVTVKDVPPGKCMPLLVENNLPFVSVQLGREMFNVCLDTGCLDRMLVLTPQDYNRMREQNSFSNSDFLSVNSHIFKTNTKCQILNETLLWGELKYRPVQISVASNASLLGAQILTQHALTLDFNSNKVYVSEGDQYSLLRHIDYDGILLDQNRPIRDPGFLVLNVQEMSLGSAVGLRKGDVIERVNGRAIESYSWIELGCLFSNGRSRPITLGCVRSGKKMLINLPASLPKP